MPAALITWLRRNRGFLVFLFAFGLFRTAVADWNPIPSGSMRPTLLEGDVVLVDRLAYDLKLPMTDRILWRLSEPQRGDVVTFSSPVDGTRLIKRVVAGPGDRVEMRDGVLVVNDEPAHYDDRRPAVETLHPGVAVTALQATEQGVLPPHRVQYLIGAQASRHIEPRVLGPDEFFMMGDNRDNSLDSRVYGPVPRHLLIGRAHRVLASADIGGEAGWAWAPRWERFVSAIH